MQYAGLNLKQLISPAEVKLQMPGNIIAGYASVFNQLDNQGDVILPGAFSSVQQKRVKLLWQHNASMPIGTITKCEEDDYGLYIEAAMTLDVSLAREALALLKSGAIKGLSIGFTPVKYYFDQYQNRVMEKVDLWEVSLVTFPANQNAGVIEMKALNAEMAQLSTELEYAIACLFQGKRRAA